MISLSAGILKGKASSLHSQPTGLASETAGVLVCGFLSPIGWARVTWNGTSLAGALAQYGMVKAALEECLERWVGSMGRVHRGTGMVCDVSKIVLILGPANIWLSRLPGRRKRNGSCHHFCSQENPCLFHPS